MTAREAREFANWNLLPEFIRNQIESAVARGWKSVPIHYKDFPDSRNNNIKCRLESLGYIVGGFPEGNYFEIYW